MPPRFRRGGRRPYRPPPELNTQQQIKFRSFTHLTTPEPDLRPAPSATSSLLFPPLVPGSFTNKQRLVNTPSHGKVSWVMVASHTAPHRPQQPSNRVSNEDISITEKRENEEIDSDVSFQDLIMGYINARNKTKKQKWTTLDLSKSEVDSEPQSGGASLSRGPSPCLEPMKGLEKRSTIHLPTSDNTEETLSQGPSLALDLYTPVTDNCQVGTQTNQAFVDTNTTRRPQPSSASYLHNQQTTSFLRYSATFERTYTTHTDSNEIQEEFAAIMAGLTSNYQDRPSTASASNSNPGEDAFDTVNWDPELPSALSLDESPEQLRVQPQPLAYTTVGSIVNPNHIPQFSAPNRIQREGAGRRPLMTTTNRHYDKSYARGPATLSNQNSMQYTQQLLSQTQTQSQSQSQSQSQPSLRVTGTTASMAQRRSHLDDALTDLERLVLTQQGMNFGDTLSSLSSASGNGAPLSSPGQNATNISNEELRSMQTRHIARLKDMAYDLNRPLAGVAMKHGLEKMQTLQRLSRFENPLQEHALNRLSEFSVTHSQATVQTTESTSASDIYRSVTPNARLASNSNSAQGNTNTTSLNQLSRSASTQPNPLYRAQTASTQDSSSPALQVPPGYPQPLTAGPPGQRQPARVANQSFSFNELASTVSSSEAYGNGESSQNRVGSRYSSLGPNNGAPGDIRPPNTNANNVGSTATSNYGESNQDSELGWRGLNATTTAETTWGGQLIQTLQQRPTPRFTTSAIAPNNLGPHTTLRDTAPPEEMAPYYPNGFPPGYTGTWYPLDPAEKLRMNRSSTPLTQEQKTTINNLRRDALFYYGQRTYHAGSSQRAERSGQLQPNPFGPIGPPRKKSPPPATNEPFTMEDMNSMSLADAAKPLIAALASTMESYLPNADSSTRGALSGFVTAPAHYVDDTVEGNQTMFGEDWGYIAPNSTRQASRFFGRSRP